ncbi:MarR family winged helix-turn-helix transcriptional regulator [Paenibacillus sp. NPDC058071]|uniref:MarR family winged helix-turn-helix transcriptional regulator n=1 Tax=Paenibacillus sp. NPDC058071 TaxID=3346326 RepID=UPI0036DB8F52
MTADKHGSVTQLIEVFQKFGRADWRKRTMWGLKASEVRVLLCIKEGSQQNESGITVSEISKMLFVTSPTVTQMVNSLIEHGYTTRTANSRDRRIAHLTLTDKGEQIAQKVYERYTAYFEGLIDFLGQEQSDQLIHLLTQVFEYTDEANKADIHD